MAFGGFSGFNIGGFEEGRQLAGPNALGVFVKNLMDQIGTVQKAQAEAQARFQYDPEARAKQQAFQSIESMTQPPTPAGGYNPQEVQAGIPGQVGEATQRRKLELFQKYGLLPRAQLSLEELFARSQTEAAGRLAGAPPPPKPYSSRQEDAIEGIQSAIASSNELRNFLSNNPDIHTGLLHPSMQRTTVGNVTRAIADPRVTQFTQMAFRLQDAYRRFITGVQAGFPEIAVFLPSSIPNPSTQNTEQFLAALETFEAEVRRNAEQVKRGLKLRGYSDEQIEQTFLALPSLAELQPRMQGSSPFQSGSQLPQGFRRR